MAEEEVKTQDQDMQDLELILDAILGQRDVLQWQLDAAQKEKDAADSNLGRAVAEGADPEALGLELARLATITAALRAGVGYLDREAEPLLRHFPWRQRRPLRLRDRSI